MADVHTGRTVALGDLTWTHPYEDPHDEESVEYLACYSYPSPTLHAARMGRNCRFEDVMWGRTICARLVTGWVSLRRYLLADPEHPLMCRRCASVLEAEGVRGG